jgi:trigger factor
VIPVGEVKVAVDRRIQQLATRVRVNGFRPGKAPLSEVRKKVGADALKESVSALVNERFQSIVSSSPELQSALGYFDMKVIDGADGRSDVRFSFVAEFLPTVGELPAYVGLSVEKLTAVVDPSEIEEELSKLQRTHTTVEPVADDDVVASGDIVTVSYHGIGSGVASQIQREDEEVDLATPNLLPSFVEGLTGMKRGEVRTVSFSMAKDAPVRELAGKDIKLAVTCNEIKRRRVPAIDDELAKTTGEADSLVELSAKIHDRLHTAADLRHTGTARNALLQQVVSALQLDLPSNHIGRVTLDQAVARARRVMGETDQATLERLVKASYAVIHRSTSKSFRDIVVSRAIAAREGIEITDADIDAAVAKIAEERRVPIHEVKAQYAEPAERSSLATGLLLDRVLDFLWSKATVTEVDSLTPVASASVADSTVGDSAPAASEGEAAP